MHGTLAGHGIGGFELLQQRGGLQGLQPAFLRAAGVVLAHNHPSGDPTPSADDIALTSRLVQAGQVMGIDVLDHIVLSAQRYYSLSEAGGLPRPSGKMIGP